jgi:hypothetical protein
MAQASARVSTHLMAVVSRTKSNPPIYFSHKHRIYVDLYLLYLRNVFVSMDLPIFSCRSFWVPTCSRYI